MSRISQLREGGKLPPVIASTGDEPVRDLERILALPSRTPLDWNGKTYSPSVQALIEVMTEKYSLGPRPGCKCREELGHPCITTLNPMQAWALREAPKKLGILALAGVGSGKTVLGILMPLAIPCRQAVIFVEPGQRQQYRLTYMRLREHFRVPQLRFHDDSGDGFLVEGAPVLRVLTYSRLSQPDASDLLDKLQPDLFIGDECHRIADRTSARTRRLLRHLASRAETHPANCCFWSGTLVKKSIRDQAHLAAHSLGDGSPMPLDPEEVEAWAEVFDPGPRPDTHSALAKKLYMVFGGGKAPELGIFDSGRQKLREGFQRRLASTAGVITTKGSSVGASIYIRERAAPPIPDTVRAALAEVRQKWVRPDGEELVEATDAIRCAGEVACGFFYHWTYPRGESVEQILRWFEARKAWNKELREKLKVAQVHLDSPLLCANAAERFRTKYEGDLPVWESEHWAAWLAVRDTVYHESRSKWIDDYLAADAAAWALKHRGIVWYLSNTFGRKVAQLAGLPCHGGGAESEKEILAERGDRSVIASIRAHGSGRDGLQHKFSKQLVTQIPSGGDVWEQLLGRLHREGQEADVVETEVYRHVEENRESFRKAISQAEFIQATTGNQQKLLMSDIEFE